MPPSSLIQALMVVAAALLGSVVGRTLLSPRFPKVPFGLAVGFAPVGWLMAFVGSLILHNEAIFPENRYYADWRSMEYIGLVHPLAWFIGVAMVAIYYLSTERAGTISVSIKATALGCVVLVQSLVLVNLFGFIASLITNGAVGGVLPLVGALFFFLALFAIILGVLRNLTRQDGPMWLPGARSRLFK